MKVGDEEYFDRTYIESLIGAESTRKDAADRSDDMNFFHDGKTLYAKSVQGIDEYTFSFAVNVPPLLDSDSDGYSDEQEAAEDSDPYDPYEKPQGPARGRLYDIGLSARSLDAISLPKEGEFIFEVYVGEPPVRLQSYVPYGSTQIPPSTIKILGSTYQYNSAMLENVDLKAGANKITFKFNLFIF